MLIKEIIQKYNPNLLKISSIVVFCTVITMGSCKNSEPDFQVLHKTVVQNDTLKMVWGVGVEEGVTITKDPVHSKFHNIGREEEGSVFIYVPKENFVGEDLVELKKTDWNFKKEKRITRERYRVIITIVE
jgi:hypothetical protein